MGSLSRSPDHSRVPGDRDRSAEEGIGLADVIAVAEELGLVDEQGIDGDGEAGLCASTTMRTSRSAASSRERSTARRVPGLEAGIVDQRPARAVGERRLVAGVPRDQVALDRHGDDQGPAALRRRPQLEALLEAAGPVHVPLGQGTPVVLDPFLLGMRLGRRRGRTSPS